MEADNTGRESKRVNNHSPFCDSHEGMTLRSGREGPL